MSGGTPGASTLFPFGQDFQNFNAHWGVYAAFNDLPNRPGNILIVGKWENLRVGQIARVAADSGLYICDSVGVAGGGNAVWLLVGPSGGASTDRFAPRYLVGFAAPPYLDPAAPQAAPFAYFGDPGDGSGIAAALAAAAATPGDVWIRPGTYDFSLGAVVAPLVVPPNVLVRGSGATTLIVCRLTGDQGAFLLGAGASLRDMSISVPASDAGSVASTAVVRSVGAASVEKLQIVFVTAPGGVLAEGVRLEGASTTVEGCSVTGSSPNGVVRGVVTVGLRHDVQGNTISVSASGAVGIEHGGARSRLRGNEIVGPQPINIVGDNNVVIGNVTEGAVGTPILDGGLGNEVAHNINI